MTAEPLELPHALGVRRLVLSRGNLFSVTNPRGDICPAGARELGVFWQDTRHLSHYELVLPGEPPTLLSSDTESSLTAQIDLTAPNTEFGGLVEEPENFLHVRRTQVVDHEFTERVAFTNHSDRAVEFDVCLRFDADFADLFEVRGARRPARGERLPVILAPDRCELPYAFVTGAVHRTVLRFFPTPVELGPTGALFRVQLAPGQTWAQEICVTPLAERAREEPLRRVELRRTRALEEESAFRLAGTHVACDNAVVGRILERSLGDLYALRIRHDEHWILGAGIPWFAAPFGRDSILTSLQALPFSPQHARDTLRFLAAWQGRRSDPFREEEPGKILHELRRGEMAEAAEIPHTPYYGSVDATPLYPILAQETWRWTHDRALIAEVWPAVRAAMDWIDRRTRNGTEFLTYERTTPLGLENQGWKDSREGVSFPTGERAVPPIALVEVQGYVAHAWRCAAELARDLGHDGLADRWAAQVEPFLDRIDAEFWDPDRSYYALAIDGCGRRVPTITSNPGHLLWAGAVTHERARRIADVLTSRDLYSGWGIRTVAREQTVYNPLSYHNGSVWPHDNAIAALGLARYGLRHEALRVTSDMLAATEHFGQGRLPELFCGIGRGERDFLVHYPVSCSPQAWASGALLMMLQGCLGLEADAPAGRLRIRNPMLPRSIRRLRLMNMQVGAARVGLRFCRTRARTHADVLSVEGARLKVEIEVD